MTTAKRTTQLKILLQSEQTEFILEAHNGLAAKIVEEAGFKGIWGSGLALSAQHAVRDNNELSWTDVVGMLDFMADATTIPILSKAFYTENDFELTTTVIPLGSGPWKVGKFDFGIYLEYDRVTDYWAKDIQVKKPLW